MYLEGGYWCWDEPSCTERYSTSKFDMSSSGWKPSFAQEGIFGTNPSTNPFANFNMIFIKYCSSDSWFGNAGASSDTFGFSFRGARIVAATLQALVQTHGLGASGSEERLLFGGCSAGGRGVLTNLDAFASAAPPNVHVRGLLDAAGWVDVQPIVPNMLTLQMMTQKLYGFTSPQAVIPADCAADNAGGNEWMCLWPSTRIPYIKTPYFLNAAQVRGVCVACDARRTRGPGSGVRVRPECDLQLTPPARAAAPRPLLSSMPSRSCTTPTI